MDKYNGPSLSWLSMVCDIQRVLTCVLIMLMGPIASILGLTLIGGVVSALKVSRTPPLTFTMEMPRCSNTLSKIVLGVWSMNESC